MRLAIAFLLNFFALSLQAQWQGTSPLYFTAGNVGIGTSTPSSLLHLKSNSPTLQIQSTQSGGTAALNLINDSGFVGLSIGSYSSGYSNGANYARPNGVSLHTTSAAGASAGIAIAARNTTGYLTLHTGGDTERMRISASGAVGIGTASPRGKFDVDGPGDIYLSDDPVNGSPQSLYLPGHIYISPYSGTNDIVYIQARRSDNSGTTAMRFRTHNNGSITESMHIDGSGKVGIGTTSPNEKLTVNGTIYGKEVKVDLNVPGPDYVFEKDYNLPSLEEIKNYIDQHKHLPEVPSAKEMEANGINVGEMNMILLKKVEELTLYLIEANKRLDQQQNQINKLLAR